MMWNCTGLRTGDTVIKRCSYYTTFQISIRSPTFKHTFEQTKFPFGLPSILVLKLPVPWERRSGCYRRARRPACAQTRRRTAPSRVRSCAWEGRSCTWGKVFGCCYWLPPLWLPPGAVNNIPVQLVTADCLLTASPQTAPGGSQEHPCATHHCWLPPPYFC